MAPSKSSSKPMVGRQTEREKEEKWPTREKISGWLGATWRAHRSRRSSRGTAARSFASRANKPLPDNARVAGARGGAGAGRRGRARPRERVPLLPRARCRPLLRRAAAQGHARRRCVWGAERGPSQLSPRADSNASTRQHAFEYAAGHTGNYRSLVSNEAGDFDVRPEVGISITVVVCARLMPGKRGRRGRDGGGQLLIICTDDAACTPPHPSRNLRHGTCCSSSGRSTSAASPSPPTKPATTRFVCAPTRRRGCARRKRRYVGGGGRDGGDACAHDALRALWARERRGRPVPRKSTWTSQLATPGTSKRTRTRKSSAVRGKPALPPPPPHPRGRCRAHRALS